MSNPSFAHLHVHSQFSLLDGAASIKGLVKKAAADGMSAIALTDHGNMFGAFQFVAEAAANGIKPIVGCEFYMVADMSRKEFSKGEKDRRYHQLLLAMNAQGYANLTKLCSLGYIDGLYSKWPRIDKKLLVNYTEGLIATSCCIGAELPQTILEGKEAEAEEKLKWWMDVFPGRFYLELQRHGLENIDGSGLSQEDVNQVLLRWADKYNLPVIATNDSHYLDESDFTAHDILLCVNTGELLEKPVGDSGDNRYRWQVDKTFYFETIDYMSQRFPGHPEVQRQINAIHRHSGGKKRFGFPNNRFYFKTQEQMATTFADLPQALETTLEIADRVEMLQLKKDILLPNFEIPAGFANQDDYLHHLTYEGAAVKYEEITTEVKERLDFELNVIRTMGFAGYFLIVADFIREGRQLGVFVGPGRGSAAGSAVAYCIGITNIDPIKYNLLFERFLNPDRKSMPDIDTDFDDAGRQKVIDYVVNKYGKNQVAQIVTYGTMAARSSIKDVARVMDLPLSESNMLAKMVPDRPVGITLQRVMLAPMEGEGSLKQKENLDAETLENVRQLREMAKGEDDKAKVINQALKLEGSIRNTGIHAAGIIIAPKDLTEILPVATSKDTDLYITQFEGKIIEDAGVIKMDFLGLRNLTIIKDCLALIRKNHGIDLNIDTIPLDDAKTYELYQNAETNGTFQFESAGMQKHLRALKPDRFDDLIAMNALYRPGPMQYIESFIARKHGREEIKYDLPEMEEYLAETYGITVYQEQVMLLSQKLAGFTKGDADVLRKAMGKKQKEVLDKMKSKFLSGCGEKGLDKKICEKVWTDWEAFAQYAFNKSHSTCYAFVAYQTAYLKAHYPSEYMAAVLTNSMGNSDKLSFFLEECRRMGVRVLGPDINESGMYFSPNKKGEIRFGLAALKGTGESAAEEIIARRAEEEGGPYTDIFDLAERLNLRTVNKKSFEAMIQSGALDSLLPEGMHRAQMLEAAEGSAEGPYLEKLLKYGLAAQSQKANASNSLFGNTASAEISKPKAAAVAPWTSLDMLEREKDILGVYISGHPLDEYLMLMETFGNVTCAQIAAFDRPLAHLAALVTAARVVQGRNGEMAFVTVADLTGSTELKIWKEADVLKMKHLLTPGKALLFTGEMQSRFNGQKELAWKDAVLLQDLRDRVNCVEIVLHNLHKLDKRKNEALEQLCREHAGLSTLRFIVTNPENENHTIKLVSQKYRVYPSYAFLNGLERLELGRLVLSGR